MIKMDETQVALLALASLERDAEQANKNLSASLEANRRMLHGAVIMKWSTLYSLTDLVASGGSIWATGVRYYSPTKFHPARTGNRSCALGRLRDCKIVEYPNKGDSYVGSRQNG